MKTYKNLSSEIKALNAETNAITAKINQEETEKEFNINELIKKSEKISTEYHKIHASNLPIFKNSLLGWNLYPLSFNIKAFSVLYCGRYGCSSTN